MRYRRFGRLGWDVSALGFGCMRLPTLDKKPLSENIAIRESTRMVRHAIDHGLNYIDTAYGYHGGESEVFLGKALRAGYRDKVKIATKCPVWLVKRPEDFDRFLGKQLRRLRTDSVDFYLMHGLNAGSWKDKVLKHRLLDRAERALVDGRVGHLGFSFHDTYKVFREIIDGSDSWSFCQIQYNYLDTINQAGTEGLRYAASKGLAVVIMEPLLGGRLATPPAKVKHIMDRADIRRRPADLALQWLWDQPEVSVVLSGMSTMGQVKQNLRSADGSGVGSLTAKERKLVERLQKEYLGLCPIPCTKCSYCMPCPSGVNIPANFDTYNDGVIYEDLKGARRTYERFFRKKARASSCTACRKCEAKCPQRIPISEWMPEVHAVLGKGREPRGTCISGR